MLHTCFRPLLRPKALQQPHLIVIVNSLSRTSANQMLARDASSLTSRQNRGHVVFPVPSTVPTATDDHSITRPLHSRMQRSVRHPQRDLKGCLFSTRLTATRPADAMAVSRNFLFNPSPVLGGGGDCHHRLRRRDSESMSSGFRGPLASSTPSMMTPYPLYMLQFSDKSEGGYVSRTPRVSVEPVLESSLFFCSSLDLEFAMFFISSLHCVSHSVEQSHIGYFAIIIGECR